MDVGMIGASALSGVAELPPPLVRAGRAMLGWSKLELARAAGVSVASLLRLELGDAATAGMENRKVRGAMEAAGLSFATTERGGLRLSMGDDGVGGGALRAP